MIDDSEFLRLARIASIRQAERAVLRQVIIALVASIVFVLVGIFSAAHAQARGLITVNTDAGTITVAPEFAAKIVPFINAVVALNGGAPKRIKCYSRSGSHVAGSLHFIGRACDFDQHGWGKTSYKIMYRLAALARQYGLRDGCEFRDWGHVDDGPHLPDARTHGCKSGPFIAYSQMAGAAP